MYFQNLNGIETYYPTTLKFEVDPNKIQLILVGKIIRHKWVKYVRNCVMKASHAYSLCVWRVLMRRRESVKAVHVNTE